MSKKKKSENKTVNSAFNSANNAMMQDSYPFIHSHPSHLKTLASLFGMKDLASLKNARVLEIGCLSGGNITPIAYDYPEAEFVGVDFLEENIAVANNVANSLGLKNITFHTKSILDLGSDIGKFDYIIAHGVFSYLSKDEQEHLIKASKEMLNPSGLVYVSYNTLPGWGSAGAVRDMVRYHANRFVTAEDKVIQARLFLDFAQKSAESINSYNRDDIAAEAKIISTYSDAKLLRDYLSPNDNECYFYEFINSANKFGLQYLADADLSSMYIGNLPKEIEEKLSQIGDIINTEQYMDFINNRRYRATILCNGDVALNRNISYENVENFYMYMNIAPKEPFVKADVMDASKQADFLVRTVMGSERNISTSSPILKAILYSFSEVYVQLQTDDIISLAVDKLDGIQRDEVRNEFMFNVVNMILAGLVHISADLKNFTVNVSEKPKVSDLARIQASNPERFWVTNMKHERFQINILEKHMISLMDGNKNKEEIVNLISDLVAKGDLVLTKDEKPVSDLAEIRKEIANFYDNIVRDKLAPCALLVA